MYDFSILDKTGLRKKGELDKLFGVSRITVYGYVAGQKPSKRREKRVTEVLKVLGALVTRGQLPFADDKPVAARKQAIEKILSHVETRI